MSYPNLLLKMPDTIRMLCHETELDILLTVLSIHCLDLVLAERLAHTIDSKRARF